MSSRSSHCTRVSHSDAIRLNRGYLSNPSTNALGLSLALAHMNDGWYRTSGHVGQFTDYAVKDTVTGSCFRADHLVAGMLMPHTNMPPHARL